MSVASRLGMDWFALVSGLALGIGIGPATGCGEWPEGAEPEEDLETELAAELAPGVDGLSGELSCHNPGFELAPDGEATANARRPGGLVKDQSAGELLITHVRCKPLDGKQQPRLPLEHTDVVIQVAGFVARATVTQTFANPYAEPLEAAYVFPLPDDAAVDAMTMRLGDRVVRAEIARREEARKRYDEARQRGQRAALLEQERANIFTQSVVNIMPGDRIQIEIQYVQMLRYEEGTYELVFPMVVGPRYIPGAPIGVSGAGWAADTDRVPDASRITPPVLAPTERSGHDISLSVHLDAGVPIQGLYSSSHALSVWEAGPSAAFLELSPADRLPNKDFVLHYEVAGNAPQVALLPHFDTRGGFFSLIVQPQRDMSAREITPREIILIADTSGSMSGFPIEKSKQAMRRLLGGMRRSDRFNIVRFAGDTATLFAEPQPFSQERLVEALAFVDAMRGSGGTEMAAGIVQALSQPSAPGYLRVAILLTDGFVDEAEVFDSIHAGRRSARVFTLGIGSSPNRYLLDRAAQLGRGEAFFLRHDGDTAETIGKLYRRIDRPALRNIEIDWAGLDVTEVYPSPIPDLFAGQPLFVFGRYRQGGDAEVVVTGDLARGRFSQTVAVTLPTTSTADTSMASTWARQKIKSLMLDRVRLHWRSKALTEEITTLGIDFNLMTEWTSFIAVEDEIVNARGQVCFMPQPVELPEGVSYQGVFGEGPSSSLSSALGGPEPGCRSSLGVIGGDRFGEASGFGGLGSRGTGAGGYGAGYGTGGGVLYGTLGSSASYGAGGLSLAGRGAGGGGISALGGGVGILGARASRSPSISMSAPIIMGSLSKDVIRTVIDKHRNQIRYCYELELQRQQDLHGKVSLKIVINERGLVSQVTINESTLANAKVEACIMAKIKTWRFPAIEGAGTVEVNYPFIFQPAEE